MTTDIRAATPIQRVIRQRGLKQVEVAKAIGLPIEEMSKVVNGWRTAAKEKAVAAKVADYLGEPPEVLFPEYFTTDNSERG